MLFKSNHAKAPPISPLRDIKHDDTGEHHPLPQYAKKRQRGWIVRTLIKVRNKYHQASGAPHHQPSAEHTPRPSTACEPSIYTIPPLQLPAAELLDNQTFAAVSSYGPDTIEQIGVVASSPFLKRLSDASKELEDFTPTSPSTIELSPLPLALGGGESLSCLITSLHSMSSSISSSPPDDYSSTQENSISTHSSIPSLSTARDGAVAKGPTSNPHPGNCVPTPATPLGLIRNRDSGIGPSFSELQVSAHSVRIALPQSGCDGLLPEKIWSRTHQRKFRTAMHKLKMKIAQTLNLSPTPQETPDINSASSQQDIEDRCQWGIIRSISNAVLKNLLLESLPAGRKKVAARIRGKSGGAYHHVVYLDAMDIRAKKEDFVIKIPGHGTPDRWGPEEEYMLVREAETMRYLFNNTTIPVPEIIAYSGTLDNTVGFPYIIMTRLSGQSAANIWFEQPFGRDIADEAADFPSLDVEKKRLNFLRSLAEEMTKLQDVQFSAIGMPSFKEDQLNGNQCKSRVLSVDKIFVWPYTSDIHKVEERPAFASTQDFVRAGLDDLPDIQEHEDMEDDKKLFHGIRKILDIVSSHPVFQSRPDKTFILQHDDLDLQNILTDTEGNVTGIIDWDGSLAMPRCVASAAVPRFLRRDWFPGFYVRNLHMNLALPRYREIYAAAMSDAGNSDAKYTTKSALYQAVFASIYEGGSIYDLSEKLVNLVMSGRPCKAMDFLIKLGDPKGWKSIEPILQNKLNEILEPELLSITWSQVKAKLADRAALEWATDFVGSDELDEPEMKSG